MVSDRPRGGSSSVLIDDTGTRHCANPRNAANPAPPPPYPHLSVTTGVRKGRLSRPATDTPAKVFDNAAVSDYG